MRRERQRGGLALASILEGDLVRADLSDQDLSGVDLRGRDLTGADLRGARLVGTDLRQATLAEVEAEGVEFLGAQLSGADLSNANLEGAGLGSVAADGAVLFGAVLRGATLSGSDFRAADLRTATLSGARIRNATLDDALFDRADLTGTDVRGSSVANASFAHTMLDGAAFADVTGYRTATWVGAELHGANFTGAWLMRRHVNDENYLHEFRSQSRYHEWIYRAWWLTSDCGRSLLRWGLWTAVIATLYAIAYDFVDIDWGDHRTPLSPLYYSVVTFTTLGYGDVLPGSTGAQLLAMSEVILGYFSLGGMLSILSDKIARRAE